VDVLDEREYLQLPARDIAAAVNAGLWSAVEMLDAALARLQRADSQLRAVTQAWPDRARARGARLVLAGVPIGVKATEARESVQTGACWRPGAFPSGHVGAHPGHSWADLGTRHRLPDRGRETPRSLCRTDACPAHRDVSTTLGFADTHPEIAAVAASALQRLADRVEIINTPVHLRDPQGAWQTLRARQPDRQRTEAARTVRCHNDDRLQQLFRMVDLLATPTTPNAPHGHDGPGDAISVALTWASNLSGHPALSIPAGLTQAGAPVGLQLVARPGSKQLLLELAAAASVSNLILRMSGT
jgi:Asp-tRNA(Asn)/Glu-tRNA(Gln) amidotransferase A subunit family amidase